MQWYEDVGILPNALYAPSYASTGKSNNQALWRTGENPLCRGLNVSVTLLFSAKTPNSYLSAGQASHCIGIDTPERGIQRAC